ncbi:MAG: hypothetical protein Q7R68_11035 [Nitrospirales bacterium]|nr:hypothetical protein [Nitrospirales bacterium]
MPVFTTAAVAVAAAVASTTAITVAAAVVAVSAAIGVVGLALSVVGAITGDQTISKIGKYMGYAGIAGGLAGGAIGGIGALSAGAEGGFLAGATKPFETVASLTDQVWKNYGELNLFTGTTSIADQASAVNITSGAVPMIPAGTGEAGAGVLNSPPPLITDQAAIGTHEIEQAGQTAGQTAGQAPVNPPPAAAPGAPTVLNTDATTRGGILNTGANLTVGNPAGVPGATSLREITASPGGFLKWFNEQDAFTKYAVMQGGAGLVTTAGSTLSGLYASANESDKLRFEQERQSFVQAQQAVINQRTGTAPSVTFDKRRAVADASGRVIRPADMLGA